MYGKHVRGDSMRTTPPLVRSVTKQDDRLRYEPRTKAFGSVTNQGVWFRHEPRHRGNNTTKANVLARDNA